MQSGIFEYTGIMGQALVHPYIQSTTVLCDNCTLYNMTCNNLWKLKQKVRTMYI